MKIHHIMHTGANNFYWLSVLNELRTVYGIQVKISRLNHYEREGNWDGDVLTYQTFPDENQPSKFNPKLTEKTDKLFNEFQGLKILVDSHDDGDKDAFTRFNNWSTPRIKAFPSKRFMKDYNVVLKTTFSSELMEIYPDKYDRDIILSCKFGEHRYHHDIRDGIKHQLEKFSDVNFEWEPGREAFIDSLRKTLISIAAPGHGQHTATHQCTFRSGALLFTHTSFNDIHYLPHYDLVDGVDFISYDLFNFTDKLKWVLSKPDMIHNIRMNGQHALEQGYNLTIELREHTSITIPPEYYKK